NAFWVSELARPTSRSDIPSPITVSVRVPYKSRANTRSAAETVTVLPAASVTSAGRDGFGSSTTGFMSGTVAALAGPETSRASTASAPAGVCSAPSLADVCGTEHPAISTARTIVTQVMRRYTASLSYLDRL